MSSRESGPRPGRSRSRALRDRYPLFFAFEAEPARYLTHEESIAADPPGRIRSIWPFLVKVVMRFHETLRPRERANFDPEDVLMELTCKLLEVDAMWAPARGRYITFAARVARNELHKVRDRTRTVKSPGNTFCRLKEYEAEERELRISGKRAATLDAIRRVLADSGSLEDAEATLRIDELPEDAILRREEQSEFADAVVRGLMALTAEEADVIARGYGLNGQPERAVGDLAQARRLTRGSVLAVQDRARQKIKDHLIGTGHPAARRIASDTEDNP